MTVVPVFGILVQFSGHSMTVCYEHKASKGFSFLKCILSNHGVKSVKVFTMTQK